MTDDTLTLSDMEIDYLRELVNIGTGSAAGTLTFLMRRPVSTEIPSLHIGRVSEIASLFGHRDKPLMGIRLALTGDISGSLTFFLAEAHRRRLVDLARWRTGAQAHEDDRTILTLVAQAVANSNLDAIKRFCGLDIRHSTPVLEPDLSQALLSGSFPASSDDCQALLIESTFIISEDHLKMYLLLLPDRDALQALISSIDYVTRKLFGTG